MVNDLRPQNATIKDDHFSFSIRKILQRNGRFWMWSVLDLTDGYHQIPMKKEHRHITCMSTTRGTMQWKVQVMGLKNAGAQFRRMMEWVLADLDFSDPYTDDIIVGSTGDSVHKLLENHYKDVRRVLNVLQKNTLVCSPKKIAFFLCDRSNFAAIFCAKARGAPLRENLCPSSSGKHQDSDRAPWFFGALQLFQ